MSEDKRVEPTSLLWYHPDTIIYSDKKDPKYCPFLALISLGHSKHSGPPGTYAMKALVHSSNGGTRALEGRLCTGGTWGTLFSKLPKALSSHHASLLSKCVGPIRKNLPPFTFAPRIQTRRMREGNRSCCPTPWSVFDLPGDRQFVLGKVWKAQLVLQLKERITPPSHTRNSRQEVFCKKQRVPPKISQNSQENTCASVSFSIHF